MTFREHEIIKDIIFIENISIDDNRGSFNKIFSKNDFLSEKLKFNMAETYYSVSKKNVIRGLHFQKPPYEHDKIVHVIKGRVIDVIVDLRKDSDTYGKLISVELTEDNSRALYIPIGFAHGFKCMEDDTIMLYMVSSVFNAEADSGIRWDSIEYDWNIRMPIISEKDQKLCKLRDFKSPF